MVRLLNLVLIEDDINSKDGTDEKTDTDRS